MKKKDKSEEKISKTTAPKWFYLILILIPILFFVFLEIFLRIINYGNDYTEFLPISKYYPNKIFLNPEITAKYFPNLKEKPGVIPDGFDKVKKENTFRVFVLGGSSTEGWPYVPNASFPRDLKRRLELLYPNNTIEVINCGISAINTYTIRDFLPGILKQHPDLILFYGGHNEYYGALGAASTISFGKSISLKHAYLWMQKFKTTQLLQNIVSTIYGWFASDNDSKESKGTLMARMIGKSLIPLNSELYNEGIEQFETNMKAILKMTKDAKVPVILGTLTCNLKDLPPFVSVKEKGYPEAKEIFYKAKDELNKGNINEAKKLFLEAKELDALRFRAPQKINKIIRKLGEDFKYNVVDIDSAFKAHSPDGIVGYNLTVDHLHPTINGYKLMEKVFFDKMQKLNFLPNGKKINISETKQDSLLNANFPLTKLDSTLAEMKILILTGEYPFVPKGKPNEKVLNYKLKDFIDSTSAKVINKDLQWESAHAEVADWYYKKKDYKNFKKEINAIISERPYFDSPYKYAAQQLIDAKLFNDALPYLIKLNEINSTYFSNKWLGQIYLENKNYKKALIYLEKASEHQEADYQVWYNLSGAYYFNNNNRKALTAVEKSLSMNPRNPLAVNLYHQLKSLTKK